MALIHCDFRSEVLGLHSSVIVILPERPYSDILTSPTPKFPTLYLLHGLTDDHTRWQRQTSIERYAEEKGIAVVMPAVHRSYYADMTNGYRYWTYVSEEVPARAREMFPLSAKREENFVAGLSMGGYGAFKMALRHPEQYAAAASLSGALDVANLANLKGDPVWENEMRTIFGDLSRISASENDLFYLAEQVAASDQPKPRLYQWCGTEDFLYPSNLRFRDFMQGLPLDFSYSDGPGDHTWRYWDSEIEKVLDWLPIEIGS